MSGDEGRVPTIHEVEGLVTAQLHARFAEQVAQLASSKVMYYFSLIFSLD